jgi:tight adherence protein C
VNADLIAVVVASLSVAAVALFATGLREIAARGGEQLLRRLRPYMAAEAVAGPMPLRVRVGVRMARLLTPVAVLAKPKGREEGRLRLRLAQGGLRGESAPTIFLASKVLLAIAGLGAFAWASAERADPLPFAPGLAVLAFSLGYYLPNAWLGQRIGSRQLDIRRGLPDALDLLVTCVEAGLGLDQAMQRVAVELGPAWPILSQELRLTHLEVNAGIRRVEAMRRLAERTGVADLKSLAATLNQTETFGTSVGGALRVQAESMRIQRMQRAEEKAAVISVKLMIPLVVCVLPSLIAVIIGPAIVNISTTLFPVLGRH